MLKVFTAIEIRHLAGRVAKKSIPEVLSDLKEAGLDSLTGGGAEIFDAGVRDRICRGKESGEEWLEVHRIWHGMGGRSTATMLYGHVETAEQRVDHLEKLRGLDEWVYRLYSICLRAFADEVGGVGKDSESECAGGVAGDCGESVDSGQL